MPKKNKPLRVCLVSPIPPPFGGISNWTTMLLRYMTTQDNVQIKTINIAPHWRVANNCSTWKRVIGGGIQLVRDISLLLIHLVFRRPDVIHLATSGQLAIFRDISMIRTANLFRVPVVYHLHFGRISLIADADTNEWRRITAAMQIAHTVIPIDPSTEQAIKKHLPDVLVSRVPNCINPDELPESVANETSKKTMLFLGWVIPTKGIDELLDAWSGISPGNWRLLIIGPYDQEYRDSLRKYDAAQVEFTGEMEHGEAMHELAKADAFILPSYTEGFPYVILEAMMLKKPIIATNVGAIPEMLSESENTLIAPKSSEQLRIAIQDMMSHPEKHVAATSRSYEKAMREYSIQTVVKSLTDIWSSASGKTK